VHRLFRLVAKSKNNSDQISTGEQRRIFIGENRFRRCGMMTHVNIIPCDHGLAEDRLVGIINAMNTVDDIVPLLSEILKEVDCIAEFLGEWFQFIQLFAGLPKILQFC
jgi:hypothetical protein